MRSAFWMSAPLSIGLLLGAPRGVLGQASDQAALQGTWTLVSASRDGMSMPGMADSRRVASGDTTTVIIGGQLLMRATFRLDPKQQPKTIDYHILAGPTAGSEQHGIYALADSTVQFCFSAPGAPRPAEFTSKAGDGRTCSVWKRAPAKP